MTGYIKCNLKPANMRGVKSHAMVLCVRRFSTVPFIITSELDPIHIGNISGWQRRRDRTRPTTTRLETRRESLLRGREV